MYAPNYVTVLSNVRVHWACGRHYKINSDISMFCLTSYISQSMHFWLISKKTVVVYASASIMCKMHPDYKRNYKMRLYLRYPTVNPPPSPASRVHLSSTCSRVQVQHTHCGVLHTFRMSRIHTDATHRMGQMNWIAWPHFHELLFTHTLHGPIHLHFYGPFTYTSMDHTLTLHGPFTYTSWTIHLHFHGPFTYTSMDHSLTLPWTIHLHFHGPFNYTSMDHSLTLPWTIHLHFHGPFTYTYTT